VLKTEHHTVNVCLAMSTRPFDLPDGEDFPCSLLATLLPSEWKLLLLVSEDMSVDEIVETLFISPKSIETYITRIGEKLHMKGSGKVCRFARRNKKALRQYYERIY
jgi:DNA-binding NarL/FixJ family response regulator